MKFLLILLLTFPTFAQVTTKYDKFKDETLIESDSLRIGRVVLTVKALHKGQKADDAQLYLVFRSSSRSWLFLRSHELVFLADGERIEVRGSHDGRVTGAGVVETMVYSIDRAELEKLANALSLEMKLGFYESKLKDRKGMKEILGYVVK